MGGSYYEAVISGALVVSTEKFRLPCTTGLWKNNVSYCTFSISCITCQIPGTLWSFGSNYSARHPIVMSPANWVYRKRKYMKLSESRVEGLLSRMRELAVLLPKYYYIISLACNLMILYTNTFMTYIKFLYMIMKVMKSKAISEGGSSVLIFQS